MNKIMRTVYVNGFKISYNIYQIKAEFVAKVVSNYITIPQKIFENLQNYTVKININNNHTFTQKLTDKKIYIPFTLENEEVVVKIEVVECQ